MKKLVLSVKEWLRWYFLPLSARIENLSLPVLKTKAIETTRKEEDLTGRIEEFLNARYQFRFNSLTEVTEYALLGDNDFQAVGPRELNSFCLAARREGLNCWDRDIVRYVHSRQIAAYHPFQCFMNELPRWDGCDRVSALSRRVSDNPVWMDGFHRWMLGVAAQWMGVRSLHANSVAPVLVSLRQGMNKSTFCKQLVPDELQDYYTDSFDLNTTSGAEHKLTLFGLINLDELDRYSNRKMAALKNLMQMAAVRIRRAHKKNYSALPRIASFIATSNEKELLSDPSGSRRFLCVEVREKIDCSPIDYPQIYAQLKEELLRGERSWFTTAEELAIRDNNAPFQKHSILEDLLLRHYRIPHQTENGELIAAINLFEHLKKNNPGCMPRLTPGQFSRELIRLGVPRIHTREGNRYQLIPLEQG